MLEVYGTADLDKEQVISKTGLSWQSLYNVNGTKLATKRKTLN